MSAARLGAASPRRRPDDGSSRVARASRGPTRAVRACRTGPDRIGEFRDRDGPDWDSPRDQGFSSTRVPLLLLLRVEQRSGVPAGPALEDRVQRGRSRPGGTPSALQPSAILLPSLTRSMTRWGNPRGIPFVPSRPPIAMMAASSSVIQMSKRGQTRVFGIPGAVQIALSRQSRRDFRLGWVNETLCGAIIGSTRGGARRVTVVVLLGRHIPLGPTPLCAYIQPAPMILTCCG